MTFVLNSLITLLVFFHLHCCGASHTFSVKIPRKTGECRKPSFSGMDDDATVQQYDCCAMTSYCDDAERNL